MKNYDEVFTLENLYNAYLKCIKKVRWKESTQRFIDNDLSNIIQIYEDLKKRRFKTGSFHYFDIMERGKKRHIASVPIRERVMQRCLCDNFLVPLVERYLIYECGATRVNKGINFQVNLFKSHVHKFYLSNKRSNQGYILLCDIHNYFGSINHELLIKKLERIVKDKDLMDLLKQLINDFKGDSGLGLGSQISQILALLYLSDMDHYIKERLHIKYYARYMDDFYLIDKDKEKLEKAFKYIRETISNHHLELNEEKSRIQKLTQPFIFLKMNCHLKQDGKLIRKVTNKTFRRKKVTKQYLKRFTQYKRYRKRKGDITNG